MQACANPPERFPNVIEYTALRKDGSTFPVTMYLSPIVTDGRIAGMRGIGIDKSEIARFETALTESTERFRAIFDSTYQFTGMLTPEGMLIEANRTALDFIGAKREDVVDGLFWETGWWAGDPGRVERIRNAIRKAASGSFVRYEETLRGIGGTVMNVDFSLKPVRGTDGNVRLLIAEGWNITPQKQAEAALRESEERLRTLLTMTPDIIWQTDARNRFTYVSPQVESVLGYRPEELVGHEVSLFFEPGYFEQNREAFVAAAAGHTKSIRVVTCWRDREGRPVRLESHATPYYAPDGTLAGFSGIDRILPDKKP
jgi:PAS domain S-box-containing protein